MHDTNEKQPSNTPSFAPEDMVNASELKDFLFCQRAWFLNQHGFRVSDRAIQEREAGIAFHLGNHLKTGHTLSLQNRPTELTQNKS